MRRKRSAMNHVHRCWIKTAILACLCLLVPRSSLLIAPAQGEPTFFERDEHYYKAKGFSVRVKWDVPQRRVEEGHDLTATLVITGATNPTEVVKPDLKKLPAFANFSIPDVTDSPIQPDDKEIRFTYKLRPRNRSVTQVPALDFRFLSLAAPPGRDPFRLTRADAVPITVTEPPPSTLR